VARGRFITIEGGEGAGKTTQVGLLVGALTRAGIMVRATREPGGSPGAEAIRRLLLEGEGERWDAVGEALLLVAARRDHVTRLIDWAFREFNNYRLFSPGDKVDDGDVWLGAETKVPLSVGRDLVVTLPRRARKDMKVTLEYDRPIPAPVEKGTTVGRVVVTVTDFPAVESPLVAAASVERMNTFGRIATLAGYLVWGQRR